MSEFYCKGCGSKIIINHSCIMDNTGDDKSLTYIVCGIVCSHPSKHKCVKCNKEFEIRKFKSEEIRDCKCSKCGTAIVVWGKQGQNWDDLLKKSSKKEINFIFNWHVDAKMKCVKCNNFFEV